MTPDSGSPPEDRRASILEQVFMGVLLGVLIYLITLLVTIYL